MQTIRDLTSNQLKQSKVKERNLKKLVYLQSREVSIWKMLVEKTMDLVVM
mgnify:CR=1 FL=1